MKETGVSYKDCSSLSSGHESNEPSIQATPLESYTSFMSELSSDPENFKRGAVYAFELLGSPKIHKDTMRRFNAQVQSYLRREGYQDALEVLAPRKSYIDTLGVMRSVSGQPQHMERLLQDEFLTHPILENLKSEYESGTRFALELQRIQQMRGIEIIEEDDVTTTTEPITLLPRKSVDLLVAS